MMKKFLGLCFFLFSILSCVLPNLNAQETFNVGYRVVDFKHWSGKYEEALTVAVWYPTAAQPKPYTYAGSTSGNVAINAAPYAGSGPYPLLVFSHGYGGSGLSAIFLTEALAARGWIVACPDHHDRYSAVRIRTGQVENYDRRGLLQHAREIASSSYEDREAYLYRLDEIEAVLDGMLASDTFGRFIDRDRIAVGGHSFGGFTALGVCGTIKEYSDARIKAALLFSTGAGGYLFTEDELSAVRVPSMLFLGEREKDAMRGREMTMAEIADKVYRNMPTPKYFLEIKGANHLSFNNQLTGRRLARLLRGDDEQLFDVISRYSIAFLEKYVAGSKDAEQVLNQNDPLLTLYLRDIVSEKNGQKK